MITPPRTVLVIVGIIMVAFFVAAAMTRLPAPAPETAESVETAPAATPSVSNPAGTPTPSPKTPSQNASRPQTTAPVTPTPATSKPPLTAEQELEVLRDLAGRHRAPVELVEADFWLLSKLLNISQTRAEEMHVRIQRQVDLLEMGSMPTEPYARWLVDSRGVIAGPVLAQWMTQRAVTNEEKLASWTVAYEDRFADLAAASLLVFCTEPQLAEVRRAAAHRQPMSSETKAALAAAVRYLNVYVGCQLDADQ